jgi:hypothetical protein
MQTITASENSSCTVFNVQGDSINYMIAPTNVKILTVHAPILHENNTNFNMLSNQEKIYLYGCNRLTTFNPSITYLDTLEYHRLDTLSTSNLPSGATPTKRMIIDSCRNFNPNINGGTFRTLTLDFLSTWTTTPNVSNTILKNLTITNNPLIAQIIFNNDSLLNVTITGNDTLNNVDLSNNPNLVSPTITGRNLKTLNLSGCALSQTAVDTILAYLATLQASVLSGATYSFNGGTSASPTGGINNTDKLIIEAAGGTVNIN